MFMVGGARDIDHSHMVAMIYESVVWAVDAIKLSIIMTRGDILNPAAIDRLKFND